MNGIWDKNEQIIAGLLVVKTLSIVGDSVIRKGVNWASSK